MAGRTGYFSLGPFRRTDQQLFPMASALYCDPYCVQLLEYHIANANAMRQEYGRPRRPSDRHASDVIARAPGKLADGARPSPSTPGPSRPATKPSRPPITTRTRATCTGELPNHCEFRAARARDGAPCRHAAMLAMESGVPFWVEQQAYDPCPRLSPRQELEVRRLQPSSPMELGRAVRPLDVHLGG